MVTSIQTGISPQARPGVTFHKSFPFPIRIHLLIPTQSDFTNCFP